MPGDDCQINLDELAYAIWHDDEAVRNVSVQAYELGVFKRDLIPVIYVGEPYSYVALKALTAITYPPGATVEDYGKHMKILSAYKLEASFHPELFVKVMEYMAGVIDNPSASDEELNRAEMAITFIRNIAIVPCECDVHERLFKIFNEALVFDVIAMLNISRLGTGKVSFARLLCGVLCGCFAPFLPLKIADKDHEQMTQGYKQKSSLLSSFLEQERAAARPSARHGRWGSAVTVKRGKSDGFTVAGIGMSGKPHIPETKHLRGPRRPFEAEKAVPVFTKEAEEVARKIMGARSFPLIFEKGFPKTFNAYDIGFNVRDQMQLVDVTRFFMDFAVKYKIEVRAEPLASPDVIGYFQSAGEFWLDSKAMTIHGITALTALHSLCRLYASMSSFLAYMISEGKRESDVQAVCGVVSRSASIIEDILVSFLTQKNLTKKPLSTLRDNIIAIERLYALYGLAEEHELVRVRYLSRDEDTRSTDEVMADRIEEKRDSFDADMVIDRLCRRQNVLTPFFILLDHFDQIDDEVVIAMTRILKKFVSRRAGLAHLFKLPFLYVINRVWQDRTFNRRTDQVHDELEDVFKTIVKKFFESARHERTVLIQIITGVETFDVYDEDAARKQQEEMIAQRLGISHEVYSMLTEETEQRHESDEEIPPHPGRIESDSSDAENEEPMLAQSQAQEEIRQILKQSVLSNADSYNEKQTEEPEKMESQNEPGHISDEEPTDKEDDLSLEDVFE